MEEIPLNVFTNVLSLLIGGGLLAFIQFLINRHDGKHDKLEGLLKTIQAVDKKVDALDEAMQERDAVLARTRILRFRDELYNDVRHSDEYFLQTIDDIKTYEKFCEKHPRFANGRTETAAKYIREEHERLFKEHRL